MRAEGKGAAGRIGTNVPETVEEREEDLLEELVRRYQRSEPVAPETLREELGLPADMFALLLGRMELHRYIRPGDGSGALRLTDYGIVQGTECLRRHNKLTQFLQLISGMPQEQAELDACRMEHIISPEAQAGVDRFLRRGEIYDRTLARMDLSAVYAPGQYTVRASLYEAEHRLPRVLAQEGEWFQPFLTLEIRPFGSVFRAAWTQPDPALCLWYNRDGQWHRAETGEGDALLPTDAFVYTVSAGDPLTEGVLPVAVLRGAGEPQAADLRELNVHIAERGMR